MLQHRPTPLLKIFALVLLALLASEARPARAQGGAPTETRAERASDASREKGATRDDLSGRVVGEGGEPFSGVSVWLVSVSSGSSSPRIQSTTVTDDDGGFVFKDLAPGIYRIAANESGHVSNYDRQGARLVRIYRPGDFASIQLVKGGVITGTVTDASGEPVVAMGVSAYRVRDLDGAPAVSLGGGMLPAPEAQTDDRGVYRFYGLPPGIYVVAANGAPSLPWGVSLPTFGGETQTFHPSSTRDTAAEITVRAGQEASGIDVQYRGDPGHRITGTVETNASGTDTSTLFVRLDDATTGMHMATVVAAHGTGARAFSFEGVADGDYDVRASRFNPDGTLNASPVRRVTVRAADATGIRLSLAPLASISGSLIIERLAPEASPEACRQRGARVFPQEVLIYARPVEGPNRARPRATERAETTPDESGAFKLVNIEAGRYRIETDLRDERLYPTAIQMPQQPAAARTGAGVARGANRTPPRATPANAPASAATTLDIRDGHHSTGLTIRFKEGAALLSGHVVPSQQHEALPPVASSVRLYLVPVERERADDPLRYAATAPSPDLSFTFKNLAPGRYHLLAREAASATAAANDERHSLHDAEFRAALRRDAEAAGVTLELQPCQRLNGFTLRFPHAR